MDQHRKTHQSILLPLHTIISSLFVNSYHQSIVSAIHIRSISSPTSSLAADVDDDSTVRTPPFGQVSSPASPSPLPPSSTTTIILLLLLFCFLALKLIFLIFLLLIFFFSGIQFVDFWSSISHFR
ncbi:unnamed protein product [Cuscuta europaea]|uniref:Transmembrane protein n=1 Tax=Cuscuta europaea TaxID=41803 RepID=A0A9P0YKI7_CUSEU|nr:unnamed protein product [Cuscuta europaea]